MKKFLLMILALVPAVASAQWSLDSCISYALSHNIDVQRRQLSVQQGEIAVNESQSAFLPRISGYASQNWNFGRGLTADNTYANRNTSSFSMGAQMSLPLFQGLKAIRSLEYSQINLRGMLEQVEVAKDNITLNVISQYLQVLYTKEMLGVANENLAISEGELQRREILLEAGKIPELDLVQAQAQVAQDQLTVTNAQGDCSLALLDLSQLLNLPADEPFDITPLEDNSVLLEKPESVFAFAMQNNHSVKSLRINQEAADKNVAVARTGYVPTLSFSAGLGTNYYNTSGFENGSFGNQIKNNFAKSLGFSLSVPIFDALSTRNSISRAKAQQLTAQLDFDETRNQLYKAINQAYTQAIEALKKQEAAETSAEMNRKAFEAVTLKYNNGKATPTEYEKAKTDYTNALAQAVQAKYEAILRARILNFYNS